MGLDYLTLWRKAGTLSGGEAQRIRLATQIVSSIVGVMYILDEPSIGLHQRDNSKLIDTLKRLRDTGNTLCDPVTGLGVPVIDRHALGDLISEEETATLPHIAYCSVGNADGTLPLLRCEAITVDGIKLGSRAVALAEHPLGDGGAYAGLWCEGCEKGEKHGELAQNAVA